MNRRNFLKASLAATGLSALNAKASVSGTRHKFTFGACRPLADAPLLKSVGFDFIETSAASALVPHKDGDDWKRQLDFLRALPVPLLSCNGFIPGSFRLTGPKADFAPALDHAEKILRRAEESGVKHIVFGSGGARNVPGDFCSSNRKSQPDAEKGASQYTEFCRLLAKRTEDLKTVTVTIEPLRPNESNIVNFVWQGAQICEDVKSPRIKLLADIFHMMMGRERAESIIYAARFLKHCHIADYRTRSFPGHDPKHADRLKPYFDALREIGYSGGISCECGWGRKDEFTSNLEKSLAFLKTL